MTRRCYATLLPLFTMMLAWGVLIAIPASLLLYDRPLLPLIELNSLWGHILFVITASGTSPVGIAFTLVILASCYPKLTHSQFICLLLTVVLAMGISLTLNRYLKSYFHEPRPNITWLAEQQFIDINTFYSHPSHQRRKLITAALTKLEQMHPLRGPKITIPPMLKRHWRHEVGYAFPSGHTLFAITLTCVVSYYLLLSGSILLPSLLFIWSGAMGVSRILLGMHGPQDVLASTLLGGIIGLFSLLFMLKAFPYLQTLYHQRVKRAPKP